MSFYMCFTGSTPWSDDPKLGEKLDAIEDLDEDTVVKVVNWTAPPKVAKEIADYVNDVYDAAGIDACVDPEDISVSPVQFVCNGEWISAGEGCDPYIEFSSGDTELEEIPHEDGDGPIPFFEAGYCLDRFDVEIDMGETT